MNKLVLANSDYRMHMSSEGEQLQAGLQECGWTLAGFGYGDDCLHVPTILDREQPDAVIVQAREDWDNGSRGCYDKRVSFTGIEALADCGAMVVPVIKDAPCQTDPGRHERWCREINTRSALLYYHPQSMLAINPWMQGFRLLRTHHSVDSDACESIDMSPPRRNAVVSGAAGYCYPIRNGVIEFARAWGIDHHRHPRYGNLGSRTNEYLAMLAGYKVHVATASSFGFALRKIIESVAMGCTPVTDLPAFDVLPEIDGALHRLPPGSTVHDVRGAVESAARSWDIDERKHWAEKARRFYDYRAAAVRITNEVELLTMEVAA